MRKTTRSKYIVLGVTGSIAAYKACEIASLLVKAGAQVQAVLTESAREFVGPATFEGITGHRVITGMFEAGQNQEIEHIAVAQRADLFLIAPATANIIAKAAHGIADDWLSTTLLATRAPILFAPAMNTNMYEHVATQANIEILQARGCRFIGPDVGRLACNTIGPGRLVSPEKIVEAAELLVAGERDLEGKHVLITSGANHEPIDPVRYIGNRSSGKMGRAIAQEALARGARVTVIAGPAQVGPPPGAEIVRVETALEMQRAVMAHVKDAHVVIGAAAVADYRVENPSDTKRKRSGGPMTIQLTENPDIIAGVSGARENGLIVVGFAAETDHLVENAKKKITEKGLDLIVANQVGGADSAFGSDTVKASIIDADHKVEDCDVVTKEELAHRLMDRVAAMLR